MTVVGARCRPATAQARARRSRDRQWLRAAAAIAALPAAFVPAFIALVVSSLLTSSAIAIAAVAIVAGAQAAGMLVRLALRRSRWAAQSTRLAVAGAVVWAGVFWAVTLRAPSVTPPGRPVPGQQTWDLATGSRIAYVHFAAPAGRSGAPIVFLHGGPAVSELPDVAPIFRPLAATGHDVYVYDQLGAGRSTRLHDPRGYTLQRAIADLEAIRVRLRAPKLILIGHSWGATLAADYLARHSDRVERVVLSSPGDPDARRSNADRSPASRLTLTQKLTLYVHTLAPRSLAGYLLTLTNPVAAHAFASDAEMDRRFGAIFARTRPGLFCNTRLANRISSDGVGHYAFQLTARESRRFEPRPILRRLRTPALILRGSCDYLPARLAREYHQLLANSTLIRISGAGHEAYLERPRAYLALITRFIGRPGQAALHHPDPKDPEWLRASTSGGWRRWGRSFGTASGLIALAQTDAWLVAFRAVQGVGAAFMMPATLSIITNAFPPSERGKAIGTWAGVSAAALAIGPVVGGFLVERVSWQSIFLLNVPVAVLAVFVALFATRESRDDTAPPRVDVPGVVTISIALTALVLALVESNRWGWGSARILALLAVAAMIGAAFAAAETRTREPMVDFSLFRSRSFLGTNLAGFIVSVAMLGMFFFLALYLQNIRGYTPLEVGVRFLPTTLIIIVAGPLGGRLTDRIGPRTPMAAGQAAVAISLFWQGHLDVDTPFSQLLGAFVLMGLGMGLTIAPLSTAAMNAVAPAKAGVASGILSMSRMVGGTFGVAALGALVAALGRGRLGDLLPALPDEARHRLAESLGAGNLTHQPPPIADAMAHAYVYAMNDALRIGTLVAVLGVIVSCVLIANRPVAALETAPAAPSSVEPEPVALEHDIGRPVTGAALDAITESRMTATTAELERRK